MMGTTRSDPGPSPGGAGAAHAAADLASHRSPSGAGRDRGCRDLGRLAGVLPAGARSNLAHVATGAVGPGAVSPGPGSEQRGGPGPGAECPGSVGSGPECPGSECSGPVGPGSE